MRFGFGRAAIWTLLAVALPVPAAGNALSLEPVAGGFVPADTTGADIRAAARFAVASIEGRRAGLRTIEAAEQQVVAGMNYRLDLTTTRGRRWRVTVHRPLDGRMQLTSRERLTRAAGPAGRITSEYTNLDLSRCQVTSEAPDGEGDSISWRCPGLGNVPIFVHSGDLRYDLDAGRENDDFETLPPFNENPRRIEWRLRDGRPFAIIFRLTLATNEQTEWSGSALGVAKVGTNAAPGCMVAWIDGAVRDANAVARNIADARSQSFACGSAEPDYIRR